MFHEMVLKSDIDKERYGIEIARANNVTQKNLQDIIDFCENSKIRMLIARCNTSNLATVQAMEQADFLLMDTLVYYNFNFDRSQIPADESNNTLRSIRSGDEITIEQVAREAFQGYYGHYHADSRLDTEKSNEAYVSWAVRSCTSREIAHEVLIAEMENQIVGFATLRMNSPEEGEGVLFGVSPSAQGKGIYRSFMINGMHWCKAQGAQQMIVSTQVNNIAVQKVWARVGFTMAYSYYTLHKWFD